MTEIRFTDSQLDQYRRDGWIVARGFYPFHEACQIKASAFELYEHAQEDSRLMKYYEESIGASDCRPRLLRIEKFVDAGSRLEQFLQLSNIRAAVRQLFGEDGRLFKDKINFRHPQSAGYDPHQDVGAGWTDYATNFVSVAVFLDRSNERSGGMQFVSGKHKQGLISKPGKQLVGDDLKGLEFVQLEAGPGDVAFFDGLTPHLSTPNGANHICAHIFLTFNAASEGDHREAYYTAKRKSFSNSVLDAKSKNFAFRVFSDTQETRAT